MSVTLKGRSGDKYEFEGPYMNIESLEDRSGVYAVLCEKDDGLSLLDVGEAAKVKERIDKHDRKICWNKYCIHTIKYAVYYIEYGKKPSRMEVEQDIRENYNLPCGER